MWEEASKEKKRAPSVISSQQWGRHNEKRKEEAAVM